MVKIKIERERKKEQNLKKMNSELMRYEDYYVKVLERITQRLYILGNQAYLSEEERNEMQHLAMVHMIATNRLGFIRLIQTHIQRSIVS